MGATQSAEASPHDAPVRLLDADTEDSSQIRQHTATEDLISKYWDDVETLADNFQHGLQRSRDGPCLGWREDDGPFIWLTYSQVWEQIQSFGSGLLELGLKGGEFEKNFVGLFSNNKPQWTIASEACHAFSLVSIPLFDTLGREALEHIIEQTELSVLCCSHMSVREVIKELDRYSGYNIKHVVQFDDIIQEDERKVFADKGINLHSWDEVVALGKENLKETVDPKVDDMATICYTSGTTGTPKGVQLTHKNMVAGCAGAMKAGLAAYSNDVHISYLPLAHIFERIVQLAIIGSGAAIGFFRGDILKLFDDIALLQPTVFLSVPRLFNRLYEKVTDVFESSTGVKKFLIDTAWQAKKRNLERGVLTHPVYDALVFRQIRNRLGGRVRFIATGGAPISPQVMEFLMICFGVPVIEGYGLTETSTAGTLTDGGSIGHVGVPLPCNEIKLVSLKDMEYFATDEHEPKGEVCFRGHNITTGYYKLPDKTEEAIDEQGWLHSGDIGMFNRAGFLKIIDRKKNMFKLAQGEYVAPEKLENVFAKSPFVSQVFIYGDSLRSKLVAVVVPDEDALKSWAKDNGISGDFEELCENDKAKEHVLSSLTEKGKESSLRGFEFPKKIHMTPKPFSLENDLLTPTFKVKRSQAEKAFKKELDAMYSELKD